MDPEAKARGRRAEERAAAHLRSLGLEILAKNLRTRSGEIDIVAREGAALVLVEVRCRKPHLLAAWRSLGWKKRARFLKAAGEARAALRIPRWVPVRLDVVLAVEGRDLVHLRGALTRPEPYPNPGC
jgi:putative endonuclease